MPVAVRAAAASEAGVHWTTMDEPGVHCWSSPTSGSRAPRERRGPTEFVKQINKYTCLEITINKTKSWNIYIYIYIHMFALNKTYHRRHARRRRFACSSAPAFCRDGGAPVLPRGVSCETPSRASPSPGRASSMSCHTHRRAIGSMECFVEPVLILSSVRSTLLPFEGQQTRASTFTVDSSTCCPNICFTVQL